MKSSHSGPEDFRGQGEVLLNTSIMLLFILILNIRKLIIFILLNVFSLFVPGILKFVLLCDIFTKHKSDLSREERQEIIQHCRKRCEIQQS